MPTFEQAQEYLASQGIDLPAFVVAAILESFADALPCLEEHYSENTRTLILLYLLTLVSLLSVDARIRSQTAASGASRSFQYGAMVDRWRSNLSLLRRLDPYNCVGALIPDDPTQANAAFFVSTGGCGCV